MKRILNWALVCLIGSLHAEDRWVQVHSGPFTVYSAVGDKAAREQLTQLEQFRHALGTILGKPDLHLIWPMRVMIQKRGTPGRITLARDSYYVAAGEGASLPPSALRELGQLLVEQNTSRMPVEIEEGLLDLVSTLQVSGTHITLGTPPANPTRAWARMQLLTVNPDYAGRTRVMINNLEQIPDLDIAYRNAYQKPAAIIEKHVDEYWKAANFGTTPISAKPINPTRDLHVLSTDADEMRLALADLTGAGYEKLAGSEATEGLGIAAVKAGRKNEAIQLFHSAMQGGGKSARLYYEAALVDPDQDLARKELAKAMELNPQWAELPYRFALLESDLDRKTILLKKATSLDPRNAVYWEALARNETAAERFIDAQKAWGGAERAAGSAAERDQIRRTRLQLQGDRAEREAAERKRKADEEARDLARVKDASLAEIRAAEARANQRLNPDGKGPTKAEQWWSGPEAGAKATGLLLRFDCMGKQGRLVVQTEDGKSVQLFVRDPGQMTLSGAGEMTLACGPQKPARGVVVVYNPKPDKKLGTAGEAASIEFR